MPKKKPAIDPRVEQALALVSALELGNHTEADRILDEIGRLRETALFQEVGRLTRQLHDTLASFAVDDRLADLTEKDIPDAKERLNYVIAMTEQAANTTLNAVEAIVPMAEALDEEAAALSAQWNRFRHREMPFEEFKALSQSLAEHFEHSRHDLDAMQKLLNEVLMAQGFQDLTGQIIRRVIQLVQDVEHSMVDMIRISGRRYRDAAEDTASAEAVPAPALALDGPSVPGIDTGAVHSQDDVDALLSSLGF
jgi:chemotaxis protein CheZ